MPLRSAEWLRISGAGYFEILEATPQLPHLESHPEAQPPKYNAVNGKPQAFRAAAAAKPQDVRRRISTSIIGREPAPQPHDVT